MSNNKKVTEQVSKTVDDLLNSGLHLSVANKDTFYLYSTDKNLLATLILLKDGKNKPEYHMYLDGFGAVKTFNQSTDFYKKLYNYVNRKYNFDSVMDQKIDKTPFTVEHMRQMWKNMKADKSADEEQKFLESLIYGLIQRKCPIDYFQRVFYCFEEPKQKMKDKQFRVLNIETKLVEYKTARKNQWFLTGENKTGRFLPMDAESKAIFDRVKIALKNQKQNVK